MRNAAFLKILWIVFVAKIRFGYHESNWAERMFLQTQKIPVNSKTSPISKKLYCDPWFCLQCALYAKKV